MSNINITPFYSKGYENVNLELIKVTTNEQGQKLVSARDLYLGLGLDKSQWARWSKKNIEQNDFFKENKDWVGFDIVSSGNVTKDFAISLEFAKHIAMMARTEKSHEYRNYFIECEKVVHNPYANLSPELQMLIKLEQGQTELNQRVGDLENNMTIDYSQQETLRLAISTRVYQLLGNAKENSKLRSKVYSNLHRCIKKQFSVNSYKNIAVKEFEKARLMITTWMPDEIMMLAIQGAKSQMSLM
ncbi:ORF6C domain-containing protein [Turicibacter sanguinis]|uniref:ORF6C domain-containing protein n=1 Tax=Turicibacter sanguinis TaxID=154288 RepID=UPI0006C5AA73|nr:ORF6C domain-containing protein [Turicibacter sanguinis]MDB8438644.1 ORF6C domain-containing protein [Turicibacter sanguinis]MTO24921.1 hypothetical protein [Turicibacter sanguinis]MTO27919.1 hypothetical protein [Turicibacter sanguinis]MTQ40701.1 hypothetical protein [Turicibacter sanguinis]CUN12706.1 Phage anti-repressor protein [Turicibacter sanguinis]